MKYISLFSGIEAATVAFDPLGWEPVAFCEYDEFPSAVLAYRFPNVPNLGDITKVDWSDYVGSVDLIIGGSPCQSFSVAGKREGLKGESGLMFEYIRAVREIMPRYFIWENVPGAFSSEKGAAFHQLLSEMDDLGYGLAWRVLDAQFFGVAQRRRRVFLVGSLGNQRAAEILFEPDSLRWDHPSSREKRKELTRAAADRASEGGGADGVAYGMSYKVGAKAQAYPISEELHPTLSASRHDASAVIPINTMVATRWNQLGRGTGFGVGEEGDPAYTITTNHEHAVCAPAPSYTMLVRCGKEGGGKGALIQEDVSATLSCANTQTLFQPTDSANAEAQCRAFSFDSLASNSMKSGNPHSGCREVDLAKTLDTTNPCPSKNQGGIAVLQPVPPSAVIASNGEDVIGALCARDYKGVGSQYVSEGKVLCMASGQANAEIEYDMTPAQAARQHKDPQIVCYEKAGEGNER